MNKGFFAECKTVEEVKNHYRKLAKQHHPDVNGGDVVMMQIINHEYEEAIRRLLAGDNLAQDKYEAEILDHEEYRAAVEAVILLEGITLELMGFWLWATGNTYPVRKELKAAGFEFSGSKQCWYFRASRFRSYKKSGETMDLDQIRDKYGSQTVANNTGNKTKNSKKEVKAA